MPTSKIMFGADFLRLLPLHSAAGIGDRCTRRRIVEQDGDIFTSSFEHLQCRGGIGVLRVPHMTVKVINLVSANTAKEQSWWKKKKKKRENFFIKTEEKTYVHPHFHLKSLAFRYIFSCEPSASPEMLFLVPSSATRDFPAWTMLPAAPTK